MKDITYSSTSTFPAAAANKYLAEWDLGFVPSSSQRFPGGVILRYQIPTLANFVDTKKLTLSLEGATTSGGTFADMGVTAVITAGASGIAAQNVELRLHPTTLRRYIKCKVAVETGGGDNTASSITASLDGLYR